MNSPKIVPRTSRRSKAVQLTCALTLNYIHQIIIFAQGGITAYNDKCNGEPKVKLVAHTYLALIQCVQFFSEVHAGMICQNASYAMSSCLTISNLLANYFRFFSDPQPSRQDLGPIPRPYHPPPSCREISRLQEDRGSSHQGNQSPIPSPLPRQSPVS
jgi:hypothetical protein